MNKLRRISFLLSAIMLLPIAFGGCSNKNTVASGTASEQDAELVNDGSKVKIVLTEIKTDENRTAVLREISDKYEADFPNTKIEIVSVADNAELEKRLRAGETTDICEVNDEVLVPYVQEGFLTDIYPYVKSWKESATLTAAAKQAVGAAGETRAYCIPFGFKQKALYYRADWFGKYEETKIRVPRTWEEVEKAAQSLDDKGSGLAIAGKDEMVDYFDSVIWSAISVGRMADSGAAYFSGKQEGDSVFMLESALNGAQQFETVFSNAVPKEALSWNNEDAIEAFMQGKTAMLIADEAAYPLLKEGMKAGTWGVSAYPRGLTGSAVFADKFSGWGMTGFAVNPDITAHFLCYLSNADNNTHYAKETNNIPIHLEAPDMEPSFAEGEHAIYVEMLKRSDWYQFASEPKMYSAYSGYRVQANEKLAAFLNGEYAREELIKWFDSYWKEAYKAEGKKW